MSMSTNAGFLDSVPIGVGMDWFTETAPDNWMLCRGQAISRTAYAELFAIIGTTYGVGNGSTTFNLPDFRGRVGVGKTSNGTFANLNGKIGTETVTLTESQMPRHGHGATSTINQSNHAHQIPAKGISVGASTDPGSPYYANPIVSANREVASFGDYTVGKGGAYSGLTGDLGGTITTSGSNANLSVSTSIDLTGGSEAHNNIQPSIVINKIIKVK